MAGSSTACRSTRVAFMVFTMANVGLPGTSGFVGEFLTLLGAFRANPWVAVLRHHRRDPVGAPMRSGSTAACIYGQLEKPSLQASPTSTGARSPSSRRSSCSSSTTACSRSRSSTASRASTDALISGYQAALSAVKTAALPLD